MKYTPIFAAIIGNRMVQGYVPSSHVASQNPTRRDTPISRESESLSSGFALGELCLFSPSSGGDSVRECFHHRIDLHVAILRIRALREESSRDVLGLGLTV